MTITHQTIDLATLKSTVKTRLSALLQAYLTAIPSPPLKKAMGYTMENNGKYIRPLLVYAAGIIFNAPMENLDIPASVVELIHTYSLIHDDLPAMDNAALRRGKPSCHLAFTEGLAILAGDALHTLAIQILASHPAPSLKAERRNQMITTLTKACGPYGMAAGQALDITVMNEDPIPLDLLKHIYALKTGALFNASLELGRLASKNDDDADHTALQQFGQAFGLAFQIQDDILDIESETETLGKTSHLDATNHKLTYPHLVGLVKAKETVQSLYRDALEAIDYLGHRAHCLRALTKQLLDRDK